MSKFIIDELSVYDIIDNVNSSIYWKDSDGKYLGCNKYMLNMLNLKKREEVIGKTDYELFWSDAASILEDHDLLAMQNGSYVTEESFIDNDNQERFYVSSKNRLLDKAGKIAGIIGTSLEITARKENERHKIMLAEQKKFRKAIGQIAHDIQSPLSSLKMFVESAIDIPENDRVNLRNIAMRITDITTYMLNKYQDKDNLECEQKQTLLVSANLLQILSEKSYEYKDVAIDFMYEFTEDSYFAFIRIEPSSFNRMLSNIINNAVEASIDKKDRKIIAKLNLTTEWVIITIEDNGKGIPKTSNSL